MQNASTPEGTLVGANAGNFCRHYRNVPLRRCNTCRRREASQQSAAAEAQSANVAESQSVSTTAQSSGAVANGTTTNSNCTSRPISAGEVETALRTSDGSPEYTAYESIEFSSLDSKRSQNGGSSIDLRS